MTLPTRTDKQKSKSFLYRLFYEGLAGNSSSHYKFWFVASLIAALVYAFVGTRVAFRTDYTIADDARVHVFWMHRFVNPALFPNDLIANYFQSVAPLGYTWLYRLFALFGVDPLLFHKLLPFGLALAASAFCYGACVLTFSLPVCGFLGSTLLNQFLWSNGTFASSTPKSFAIPLFCAFLYYLFKRAAVPCMIVVALQALFYPHVCLIACASMPLLLIEFSGGRPRFSTERSVYWMCAGTIATGALALLPFLLRTSQFGPVITASQARKMPEFLLGGRTAFFVDDFLNYWIFSSRSGILPAVKPELLWLGLLLVVIIYRGRVPVSRLISRNACDLGRVVIASFFLFGVAHALLFKFHNPSRYTQYTLPLVLIVATAATLSVIVVELLSWKNAHAHWLRFAATASAWIVVAITSMCSPLFSNKFPRPGYVVGGQNKLYRFFERQPSDIMIASLAGEAQNLPAFARRSVLVAKEFAVPYHLGYYLRFRERAEDLIRAQYATNPDEVMAFLRKYRVNFWMLDRNAFQTRYIADNKWISQYPLPSQDAINNLNTGEHPVLEDLMTNCRVFRSDSLIVLDASRIMEALSATPKP